VLVSFIVCTRLIKGCVCVCVCMCESVWSVCCLLVERRRQGKKAGKKEKEESFALAPLFMSSFYLRQVTLRT
jgi:hypothetical protein